jgi:6-phosphogluconolactonase
MKLHTIGRVAKASILSLAIILGITACSRDFTLAYVYVATAKSNPGLINAYGVDYQSGALLQLSDSPIPAGDDPVAIVAAPNSLFVYVVNHIDATVMEYSIGTDGKLYPQHTYNTGSYPVAATIDPTGSFLYVAFTLQPGFTTASPGPGGIEIFPINADNSLGTPVANGSLSYFPVGNNPVSLVQTPILTSAPNAARYLYAIDQETSTTGQMLVFNVPVTSAGKPTGPISAASGTVVTATGATGTPVGVKPSAIAAAPQGGFVYVTDENLNEIFGYVVTAGGVPSPMVASPFPTGLFPINLTIDPRGQYLYTANYNSNTVSAFVINGSGGALSGSAGSAQTATGTGPTCISIEPARGIYMFTSNALDNTVTGLQLDPHTGGLKNIENTPFTAAGLPTCVVAVANGSHPTQALDN